MCLYRSFISSGNVFESQEDLLARATEVGHELRDTSEGLEVLKEEVMALRESIRSDHFASSRVYVL